VNKTVRKIKYLCKIVGHIIEEITTLQFGGTDPAYNVQTFMSHSTA
jgi:hypothetical protein